MAHSHACRRRSPASRLLGGLCQHRPGQALCTGANTPQQATVQAGVGLCFLPGSPWSRLLPAAEACTHRRQWARRAASRALAQALACMV